MGSDSEGEDLWSSHYKGLLLLGKCSEQTSVKRETGGEETGWKWLVISAYSPKLGKKSPCPPSLSMFVSYQPAAATPTGKMHAHLLLVVSLETLAT